MTDTDPSTARTPRTREQRLFAFALMGIAGWCDASGFLLFAQLYVSFMSGDATQLGIRIGGGEWKAAVSFLGVQVLFVVGAALGRYYRASAPARGRRVALAANVVLLGTTAVVGSDLRGVPAFGFAVVAMGLQNAIMTQEAGVPLGTMITGSLARLGADIADRLRGEPAAVGDNLAQWAFFVIGALGGSLGYRALGAGSFWVPALASALLMPLAARLAVADPAGAA